MSTNNACLLLMPENGSASFPLSPLKITRSEKFDQLFDCLSVLGLTIEQQAAIFTDAKWLQSEGKRPASPVKYLIQLPDRCTKYLKINSAFHPVLDQCIRTMRKCSVVEFTRRLYAHFEINYEAAAVINCLMLFEKMHQKDDCEYVVFDPPPDTVIALSKMTDRKIVCCFNDEWFVVFWRSVIDSTGISVCSVSELVPSDKKTILIICAPEVSADECKARLKRLDHIYCNHDCYSYQMLIPQSILNDRGRDDAFRKMLLTNFAISEITMLPSGVCGTRTKMQCIMALDPFSAVDTVSIADSKIIGDKKNCYIQVLPSIDIYPIELLKDNTVREIYTIAVRTPKSNRVRHASEQYLFTRELSIQHRMEHDNRFVSSVHHCELQYVNNQFLGMTGEKIVRCSDQTLHDLSGKATYLESVAVFEDKIVERVCTAIRDVKRFPPEALSLKTYVYVHILNDIPGDFNEEICYELFFYPNSALTSLCMLGMGEANAEKIEAAVREFFGEHPDTTLTLKKVFYQMFVVFRHAVTNGYLAENPVSSIIKRINQRRYTIDARKNHADHSLSPQNMHKILGWLQADENEKMVLASSLRLMSLTTDSVIELRLGDITKCLNVNLYQVRIRADDDPEYAIPLTEELGARLARYRDTREQDLLALGVDAETIDAMPLFPAKRDITKPITAVELASYTKGLIEQLNLSEKVIDIPEEGITNLSAVTTSIFRSNFDYYVRTYGLMSMDEIDYFHNRSMHTVMGEFYCDYSRTPLMMRMAYKLKRVINLFLSMSEEIDTAEYAFRMFDRECLIRSSPTASPTMVEINLTVPPDLDGAMLHAHVKSLLGFDVNIEFLK